MTRFASGCIGVLLLLWSICECHKIDELKNPQEVYRSCLSHEKTQDLLSKHSDYKSKYEESRIHADNFVSKMKKMKDRSFKKDVLSYEKRNLFSEYDDEIATTPVVRIPIVYHVLYSTDRENLSDEQLDSQTSVLNADFRATNGEITSGQVDNVWSDRVGDSKLEFYKFDTIRTQITSSAVTCADEDLMKVTSNGGSDALDPSTYLNIWICNMSDAGGFLGYAYQPCLLGSNVEYLSGVVIGSDNVGSIDYDVNNDFVFGFSNYNLGRTGTHEVGHYLNLDHIWGNSDGCTSSDSVSDTPAQSSSNYGCPRNTTNSCTEIDPEKQKDLRDMYENYMDYTNDACMFIFTEEQVWRMRSVVSSTGCRSQMYTNGVQAITTGTNTGGSGDSSDESEEITLTCNNGCLLAEEMINDGYCHCSCCEDESEWTCQTCSSQGCPTTCGINILCDGSGDGSDNGTFCFDNSTLLSYGSDSDENEYSGVFGTATNTLMYVFVIAVSAALLLLIGIVIVVKVFNKKGKLLIATNAHNSLNNKSEKLATNTATNQTHIIPVAGESGAATPAKMPPPVPSHLVTNGTGGSRRPPPPPRH